MYMTSLINYKMKTDRQMAEDELARRENSSTQSVYTLLLVLKQGTTITMTIIIRNIINIIRIKQKKTQKVKKNDINKTQQQKKWHKNSNKRLEAHSHTFGKKKGVTVIYFYMFLNRCSGFYFFFFVLFLMDPLVPSFSHHIASSCRVTQSKTLNSKIKVFFFFFSHHSNKSGILQSRLVLFSFLALSIFLI